MALHYTPSEMVRSQPRCESMNLALIAIMICDQVHAAEDAAMQVIHDAMRSKRTVFGHSLRDTYVRATPLLLAMCRWCWCLRYVYYVVHRPLSRPWTGTGLGSYHFRNSPRLSGGLTWD